MTKRQRVLLAATVVIVVAAVAAAWALDLGRGDAADYRVTVVANGSTAEVFDLDDLRELPARRAKMQGQQQEGPSLLTVLKASGIEEFEQVRIVGMGVRDDGVIVLNAEQIGADVLLDFAARGTVKLCGPEIAWEDRVRDVERIEVR